MNLVVKICIINKGRIMEIKRNDQVDNDFYAQHDAAYIKEYESVIWQLNSIKSSIDNVYKILDIHLSNDSKNFSIEYKGEKYEFFFPTTKAEFKKIKKQRHKFIKNILCDVITGSIRRPKRAHELHTFLALMLLGEDPKNHQFEQIEEEIISESSAGIKSNESGIKALPLDMDIYQVKANLIHTEMKTDLISLENGIYGEDGALNKLLKDDNAKKD